MQYRQFDKKLARREYYKGNIVLWGIFLSAIPGVQILSYPWVHFFNLPNAPAFFATLWFVAWAVAIIRHSTWKCPRCHKPFYHKWWYGNSFSTKCLHCGLRPGDLREDFIPKSNED